MGYLIDTSVFIAWQRGELDDVAVATAGVEESTAISAITASELLAPPSTPPATWNASSERLVALILSA